MRRFAPPLCVPERANQMTNVQRVAIVDPNDATRSQLQSMLLGIESLWLEADCSRYEFFIDVISQSKPDIAIVDLDADNVQGLALVTQISRQLPSCAVLAVSRSQEGSLILQAIRNGAREFLNSPVRFDDLMAALDRVKANPGGKGGGETNVRSSRVITVAGVGGGMGCTALAVNLACLLARNEANGVVLIDLDLSLGDADVWLDLMPNYTIEDVAENLSRLDFSLLKRSLTQHSCGAYLLPRPVQMTETPTIKPEELRRVLMLMKSAFTHLVIDISKNFGPLEIAAMDVSDTILLMSQLDLPGLRNVVRLSKFLDQYHEGISDKLRVILNRMGMEDSEISISKAKETIGREIFCQLPNDYAAMVDSRNNGIPLQDSAPKARITKAITAIADVFDEASGGDKATVQQKRGLFSFLSKG